jgi:hypothetical protein
MRRTRRGLKGGHEFGGSGEDSFVAVVVTKLTGALLFILLLTMVIMALLPKAVDLPSIARDDRQGVDETVALEISTPDQLPEAIAGRPYQLALAARGASGALTWTLDGRLPEGLEFDPVAGLIHGVPHSAGPGPITLALHARDGTRHANKTTSLVVYQESDALGLPSRWAPALPPVPWKSWLEHGFGFLVLVLAALCGSHAIGALERWSLARGGDVRLVRMRFRFYQATLGGAGLLAVSGLAIWMAFQAG